MPAQVTQSGLLKKIAAQGRAAHEAVKDLPINYGNARLPAGIENGVAQLVRAWFGEFKEGPNKGKVFFMAQGVVVEPKVVNGITIEGRHTQIGPEPLCDTPQSKGKRKTFNDHYTVVIDEIAKLGVNKAEITFDQLEQTVAALTKAGPYFTFRTWQGKPTEDFPDPRVNEEWGGACEYNPEGTEAVDDSSPTEEPTPSANGHRPPPPRAPALGKRPVATAAPEPEPEAEAGEALTDFQLMELGEMADGGDQGAIDQLTALADANGVGPEEFTETKTYAEAAQLILAAQSGETPAAAGEEETEEEEEVQPDPVKADIYQYHPVTTDPKTKKKVRAKAPVECEVLAVQTKARTVTLKNLDNPKLTYKDVSWDDLVAIETE